MKNTQNDEVEKLSSEARQLYDRLRREWSIKDGAGLVTLLTACQALDRLRAAQKILAEEGLLKADRFGQMKQHPCSVIEKEARAGLLQALKHLNLDLESLEESHHAKKT